MVFTNRILDVDCWSTCFFILEYLLSFFHIGGHRFNTPASAAAHNSLVYVYYNLLINPLDTNVAYNSLLYKPVLSLKIVP